MLASVVFWQYYFDKEDPKRDIMLVDLTGNLLPSNILLGSFIGIAGGFLLGLFNIHPVLLFFIVFFFLFGLLCNFLFQVRKCLGAFKRINKFESFRKEFKEGFQDLALITGAVVTGVLEDVFDELGNLIQEFYGNHEEETHTHQDENYHHKTNQHAYNDKNTEIKQLFKKYDLPVGSNKNTIKKHFRSLAKKYHPDMPNGSDKKFIELTKDIHNLMELLKETESA